MLCCRWLVCAGIGGLGLQAFADNNCIWLGTCTRALRTPELVLLVSFRTAGRDKAEELAHQIAHFPQVCVRTDRRSAIRQHGLPVRDALVQEWYNGRQALIENGVDGATRFKDGLGRHGDFGKIY